MATKKIRTFLGVPISPDLRVRLAKLQDDLRPSLPAASWVEPESIHLTLQFLGSIPASRPDEIVNALRPVARRHGSFECRARGLGAFPNRRAARVAWVGVTSEHDALEALVRDIAAALEPLGFTAEQTPYRPHLTMARMGRTGVDVSTLLERPRFADANLDLGVLRIDEIVLFRSQPAAGGSRYSALATLSLGADPELEARDRAGSDRRRPEPN